MNDIRYTELTAAARAKFQTLTSRCIYILLCLHDECCGMDINGKVSQMTGGRVGVGRGRSTTCWRASPMPA